MRIWAVFALNRLHNQQQMGF